MADKEQIVTRWISAMALSMGTGFAVAAIFGIVSMSGGPMRGEPLIWCTVFFVISLVMVGISFLIALQEKE
ncbi:hypothetical protein ACI2KX_15930 [Ectopseudomonas khazarica]|uniref:hypothetical protein n=1 Tax=Ectopseudomonas khazarica TaxID=2502979 RepID=UPI00384FED84